MDIKDEIVSLAREMADLNSQISNQWLEVQRCLGDNRESDQAISPLNTYFRMKADLEAVEARLKTMLHTHYPGQ